MSFPKKQVKILAIVGLIFILLKAFGIIHWEPLAIFFSWLILVAICVLYYLYMFSAMVGYCIIQVCEITDILTITLIIFIILKICNAISWSWIWVLSPLWIPCIFAFIAYIYLSDIEEENKRKME